MTFPNYVRSIDLQKEQCQTNDVSGNSDHCGLCSCTFYETTSSKIWMQCYACKVWLLVLYVGAEKKKDNLNVQVLCNFIDNKHQIEDLFAFALFL